MFTARQIAVINEYAVSIGIEPVALSAVIDVESGGRIHARIAGREEPLIRFEGHYFDRLCPPELQARAREEGLASSRAGAIANPASQAARWRLLQRAAALDRAAAYASTSWGIGQVMGEHWRWLGYASVEALVAEARSGFEGQLRLMLAFIEHADLAGALKQRDWTAFARGYNGPAYARNKYHEKLAAAYRRHGGIHIAPVLLRLGDSGAAVVELQRQLVAANGNGTDLLATDGIFGPMTLNALCRFQRSAGLTVDGIAGPETMAALNRAAARCDGGKLVAWVKRFLPPYAA